MFGGVAQMVERLIRIQEATGSMPVFSNRSFRLTARFGREHDIEIRLTPVFWKTGTLSNPRQGYTKWTTIQGLSRRTNSTSPATSVNRAYSSL
ncbi:hypothetical protein M758_1G294000 [Ceratodon purpureus]|nr:hypothetical protein M758_1G294000 [Ceratodon purpureus]